MGAPSHIKINIQKPLAPVTSTKVPKKLKLLSSEITGVTS